MRRPMSTAKTTMHPAASLDETKCLTSQQRLDNTSVGQLEADICTFIHLHNQNPKPFKWTKSADQILASVKRFCHKTQQTLCGEH